MQYFFDARVNHHKGEENLHHTYEGVERCTVLWYWHRLVHLISYDEPSLAVYHHTVLMVTINAFGGGRIYVSPRSDLR